MHTTAEIEFPEEVLASTQLSAERLAERTTLETALALYRKGRLICETATRPSMRLVPVKTAEQQALLALHRGRQGQVKTRTAFANQRRGLLAEYGIVIKLGITHLYTRIPEILEDGANGLPGLTADGRHQVIGGEPAARRWTSLLLLCSTRSKTKPLYPLCFSHALVIGTCSAYSIRDRAFKLTQSPSVWLQSPPAYPSPLDQAKSKNQTLPSWGDRVGRRLHRT